MKREEEHTQEALVNMQCIITARASAGHLAKHTSVSEALQPCSGVLAYSTRFVPSLVRGTFLICLSLPIVVELPAEEELERIILPIFEQSFAQYVSE